jgi:hypothetical protein
MILGKRWRRWLRNCSNSRKVAVSIPDVVNGIALGTTLEYQGYLLAGKRGRCVGLKNLDACMYRLSRNIANLNVLEG